MKVRGNEQRFHSFTAYITNLKVLKIRVAPVEVEEVKVLKAALVLEQRQRLLGREVQPSTGSGCPLQLGRPVCSGGKCSPAHTRTVPCSWAVPSARPQHGSAVPRCPSPAAATGLPRCAAPSLSGTGSCAHAALVNAEVRDSVRVYPCSGGVCGHRMHCAIEYGRSALSDIQ